MAAPSLEALAVATAAALATATGKRAAVGRAPSEVATNEAYVVVDAWWSMASMWTLGDPEHVWRATVQVTAVGWNTRQALWLNDRVMTAMDAVAGVAISPADGSRILRRRFQSTGPPEVTGTLTSAPTRFDVEVQA